ncbi:DUF4231 domain-containing protein [Streptococcus gallolyticus]|uniref:DUF4231 domain-containing protein n=1 Tax=Streptococcus TaxID=1301 RepID=UPI000E4085B0|nr:MULTISPECIES: DUF4231 domain-containing protein [Streptococcus]RGB46799.1 DUF4231 domain-containing protein [Streptococcus gallolyticus]UWF90501.1 MAG: SMODS and SLOG-associating 2TM effector domain 2 [Bacteriophage sp.]
MDEAKYILERLDDQINWYDNKSQCHQKWYKRYKKIEILAGAIVPIASALNIANFKFISVVCSSLILACESLISLSNHQSHWTQYRTTAETLRHEKYMYQTQTGVYKNEDDKFALLVERCETIISSENINWANLQTDTSKRKGNGKQ